MRGRSVTLPDSLKAGQQDRHQQRDDGNDHQQLNQSKPSVSVHRVTPGGRSANLCHQGQNTVIKARYQRQRAMPAQPSRPAGRLIVFKTSHPPGPVLWPRASQFAVVCSHTLVFPQLPPSFRGSICYSSQTFPARSPRHFCRSVYAILGEVRGQCTAFSSAFGAV
jgi:hypothetical protein